MKKVLEIYHYRGLLPPPPSKKKTKGRTLYIRKTLEHYEVHGLKEHPEGIRVRVSFEIPPLLREEDMGHHGVNEVVRECERMRPGDILIVRW